MPPIDNAPAAVAEAAAPVASENGRIGYLSAFFATAQVNTAFDMLARLPGFTFDPGEAVRGFGGAAGNVLVDGQRPSAKSDTLESQLRRIPASSVEKIEIIRGGAGQVDMQGRALLANVVLRAAARTEAAATGSAYVYRYGRIAPNFQFDWARRQGERALTGSLRYTNKDGGEQGWGVLRLTGADGAQREDAAAYKRDLDQSMEARLGYNAPALGGLLRLNAALDRSTTDKTEQYDYRFPASRDIATTLEDTKRIGGELGADLVRPLGQDLQLKLVALQALRTQTYRAQSDFGGAQRDFIQERTTGETVLRVTLLLAASRGLTIEGGAEATLNFLDGNTSLALDGTAVTLPNADVRVRERRGEVFASANWQPSAGVVLEAGLRVEASTILQRGPAGLQASFLFPKPRLTAAWSATPRLQLRGRVEREVGQLNFPDFVATANLNTGIVSAGNARLQPERRWVAEIVAEQRFWSSGVASLTARHAQLTQLVDIVPVNGLNAPGNIPRGRRTTVIGELTLPLARLGMGGGQFKGRAQWIASEVLDPTTLMPRLISRDRPFTGTFTLTNDLPKLRSTWTVAVTSGSRETSFFINEIQTINRAAVVDLSWEWRPTPAWTLFVQANNITNFRRDRVREFYPGLRSTTQLDALQLFGVDVPGAVFLRARRAF